jgi:hypothetical protein
MLTTNPPSMTALQYCKEVSGTVVMEHATPKVPNFDYNLL